MLCPVLWRVVMQGYSRQRIHLKTCLRLLGPCCDVGAPRDRLGAELGGNLFREIVAESPEGRWQRNIRCEDQVEGLIWRLEGKMLTLAMQRPNLRRGPLDQT